MTPRTFWAILIKILGVYIILESIAGIPQLISTFLLYLRPGYRMDSTDSLIIISYLLLIMGVYLAILWCCIFKTDRIIDNLRLDQGYDDERLEFNIHRSTILKIVIMVIGGLFIIQSFPALCADILTYARMQKDYSRIIDVPESKYILIAFVQVFIGYFMLTCSRMIVNFIERKRREPVTDTSDQ